MSRQQTNTFHVHNTFAISLFTFLVPKYFAEVINYPHVYRTFAKAINYPPLQPYFGWVNVYPISAQNYIVKPGKTQHCPLKSQILVCTALKINVVCISVTTTQQKFFKEGVTAPLLLHNHKIGIAIFFKTLTIFTK